MEPSAPWHRAAYERMDGSHLVLETPNSRSHSEQLWSPHWPFWKCYAQVPDRTSASPHAVRKMLWSLPAYCVLVIYPSQKKGMVCTMPLLGLASYPSDAMLKLLLFGEGGRKEIELTTNKSDHFRGWLLILLSKLGVSLNLQLCCCYRMAPPV